MTDRPPAVDVFTSVPTPERIALEIRSWGSDLGYRRIFSERWRRQLGVEPALVDTVAGLPRDNFLAAASALLRGCLPSLADSLARLRKAGVHRAVVHAPLPTDVPYPNEATAELVAEAPDLLTGFVRVDPTAGTAAADEVVRGVAELGLTGVTITPFWHGITCNERSVRPLLEAASELGVPVWIHTSVNWVRTRPLELEHPRHVDQVAGALPDLTILCGHGGWPYVRELVAVAWRHPNVHIDVSAFRPSHVFRNGSGWDPLAYYGDRTITDKVMLGTTWTLLGMDPDDVLQEAWSSPWSEEARRAWIGENAARVLNISLH